MDLMRREDLNAVVFECAGERILAFSYRDRQADLTNGFTHLWKEECARYRQSVMGLGERE